MMVGGLCGGRPEIASLDRRAGRGGALHPNEAFFGASMKTVIIAAAALLAGLFLGGLGPRAELRRTKQELAEAKAASKQGIGSALPLALGMGGLMAARERARSVP